MTTIEIMINDGTQLVELPQEFRFTSKTISIRKEGEAVILEPLKPTTCPPGFFEQIAIDDPAFERPPQDWHGAT